MMSEASQLLPEVTPEPQSSTFNITPSDSVQQNNPASVELSPKKAEILEKPSESWETAYVWAFICKFTSLSEDIEIALRIQNVIDFEKAVENNDREILTAIIKIFHENLKLVNTANWQRWLSQYVDTVLKAKEKNPSNALFKWRENLLKTRPDGLWDLNWKEKIHLLRTLVDHQLSYSQNIRSIVDENYEKALGKPSKNAASAKASTTTGKVNLDQPATLDNPLLIRPLGLDRDMKTWWQIDDSPRLYSSGNPHKSNCSWDVLSSTQEELTIAQSRLDSDPSLLPALSSSSGDVGEDGKPVKSKGKVPAMFLTGSKKNGSPSKKIDPKLKREWQLKKSIDDVAKARIEIGIKRAQQILEEKTRLQAIEIRRQRRLAEQQRIKENGNGNIPNVLGGRVSSRLRAQAKKPDYVVDSDVSDRQFERELRKFDGGVEDESSNGQPKGRKRRKIAGSDDDSEAEDKPWDETMAEADVPENYNMDIDEDEDADPSVSKSSLAKQGRRTKRKGPSSSKPVAPQGERRSTRVKNKLEEEAEMEEEEEISKSEASEPPKLASSSAWSRAKLTASPERSERSEGSAVPAEGNGNVSVWSRGKLVYVAGNNKYAAKPLPPRKLSIAKPGSGMVLKTPVTAQEISDGRDHLTSTSANTSSLVNLQARLASMGDDDEDESGSEGETGKKPLTRVSELKKAEDGEGARDLKSDPDQLSSIFDMDEPVPLESTGDDPTPLLPAIIIEEDSTSN